jgi:hypothetical protein
VAIGLIQTQTCRDTLMYSSSHQYVVMIERLFELKLTGVMSIDALQTSVHTSPASALRGLRC